MASIKKLDKKDLKILNELDRLGPRASTLHLSKILNIPSRTIRYRISRLKEQGIISETFPITFERKLGLGSDLVLIAPSPGESDTVQKFLAMDPITPWYSTTQGMINGYITEMVYPLQSRDSKNTTLISMKKKGIIRNYMSFNIHDYEFKKADFTQFDPKNGWDFDWIGWGRSVEHYLGKEETPVSLKKEFDVVSFDEKDIAILKLIIDYSGITIREISSVTSISKTEVNERIQRLESEGIIKEYKFFFTPFDEVIYIACFLRSRDIIEKILSIFYNLPLPAYVIMCSKETYCIRLDLTLKDYKGFLDGFSYIHPFVERSFIQTLSNPIQKPPSSIYDLFMAREVLGPG